MKIAGSSIAMASDRAYVEKYEKSETLKAWVGDKRPDFEGNGRLLEPAPKPKVDILDLSAKTPVVAKGGSVNGAEAVELSGLDEKDELKIRLIEAMFEILTGKKVKIGVLKMPKACVEGTCPKAPPQPAAAQGSQPAAAEAPQQQGWGVEYDSHEAYSESETVAFEAKGIVKTTDGKDIEIAVTLNMSREFAETNDVHLRAGDAKKIDPLVINYSGTAAGLTTTKFEFDLDANGTSEQVSFVKPGSGFLALDKNVDGKINNGSELFGPQSGDGFAELSTYDEDGNNWIDENDSIFDRLRIWAKDDQGKDLIYTLEEKDVGAIYLDRVASQFSIKDTANTLQGSVNSTGVYLGEKGRAGTVQQIDLAV
ncbi:VCBS repeat-containing protein [Candidatus Aquicultor sp.]